MWGRVVNYKECQEKRRSAIKRWQIAPRDKRPSRACNGERETSVWTLLANGLDNATGTSSIGDRPIWVHDSLCLLPKTPVLLRKVALQPLSVEEFQ